MLLTAAIALFVIAVFTGSDAWGGLGLFVYLLAIGAAVAGWGLEVLSTIFTVASEWGAISLSYVTTPLDLPLWQGFSVATVLLIFTLAVVDTNSSGSSGSTDDRSSTSDSGLPPNVEELRGVGEKKATALRDAGYEDAKDVLEASKAELADIDGIGTATAASLTTTVRDRYADELSDAATDEKTPSSETEPAEATDDATSTDESGTDTIEGPDESATGQSENTDQSPAEQRKDKLVTGLEATCERIETLAEAGEEAEAKEWVQRTRAAVEETRDELSLLRKDRELRLRLYDVESRLDAIQSEPEAEFNELVAKGDEYVTRVEDALEAGNVDEAIDSSANALAAYTSAQDVGATAEGEWFTAERAALQEQIETVEKLSERVNQEKKVQEAETEIDKLSQQVASVREERAPSEQEACVHSAIEEGMEAVASLPDSASTPEIERRITQLHEKVQEFESLADQLAVEHASKSEDTTSETDPLTKTKATGRADEPVGPASAAENKSPFTDAVGPEQSNKTKNDSVESRSFVWTARSIDDTARHSTPVVLQIREHLAEDGRRNVYRAKTADEESVQLDVWHRHVDEFEWDAEVWYVFESARGQRWKINGTTGVTVSTTPEVTITQRDSISDSEMTME